MSLFLLERETQDQIGCNDMTMLFINTVTKFTKRAMGNFVFPVTPNWPL